jgi:hypothetical protein
MVNRASNPPEGRGGTDTEHVGLPRPSLQYRLKAWWQFQQALDPLATPKPLRPPTRLH